MKYRLNKNSFVRSFDESGYIMSQLTKHDRVYNESGRVFLNSLSRKAQDFEEIFSKVKSEFIDFDENELRTDFRDFLDNLYENKFLTRGETDEECDKNEAVFSYAMENTKTTTFNYLQNAEDMARYGDTSEIFSKKFHENPQVHACQIELTNKCNERCIHCYIPHQLKNKTLDFALIKDVLEQLHEMGTLGLTLSGGECFVHPDIEKILLKARELDFSINLLTNLTLLKDEQIPLLKEVNPSLVQTSLYSLVPEEHDKITQLKGSQVKTIAALEKLIAAEIPVQVSCPTMRTNYKSYKAVLEWASKRRCKAQTDFIMMARFDHSTDNLDERLTLDETRALIEDMVEADVDYGEMLSDYKPTTDIEEIKNRPVCGVAVDNICLAADGTFYPCSGWQGLPVGNAKTQRLADIWKNSPPLKMLRGIKKGSFKKCLTCADKDFCAMCLVRNFNESGDMLKINEHFCKVARINREVVENKLNLTQRK